MMKLHLLSLSKGEPHPMSTGPIAACVHTSVQPGPLSVDLGVSKNCLGILVNIESFHSYCELLVWNWRTGYEYLVSTSYASLRCMKFTFMVGNGIQSTPLQPTHLCHSPTASVPRESQRIFGRKNICAKSSGEPDGMYKLIYKIQCGLT